MSLAASGATQAAAEPHIVPLVSGHDFTLALAGDIAEFDPKDRAPKGAGLYVMDGRIVIIGPSRAGLGFYGTWRDPDGATQNAGPHSAEEWAQMLSGRLVAVRFRRAA
jgi:hypothetical protein